MTEYYVLNINVEGIDYQIQVEDLATANLLLNDNDAALKYIQKLKSTDNDPSEASCSTAGAANTFDDCDGMIWTKKKPTQKDLEATSLLLSLREKHHAQFDDRKSNKAQLWTKIAKKLEEQNFYLGDNSAERCRQKFANLTKSYLSYIKHQKTTGEEKNEDTPPFFDEMHSILGSKHKVNPKRLEDSYELEKQPHQDESREEACEDINNRFEKVKTKIKPPAKRDQIIRELKEERLERQKEFNFYQEHLKKAEEQRDRFLDILEKAFKRKRDSDSE